MTRRKIWDVVGESWTNPDGRRRQDILCDVEPGDFVELVREPDNAYDSNAVAVQVRGETVGYVDRDEATELAPLLDTGRAHRAIIHCIRGGVPDYPSYGCQISIAWDGERLHPPVELDDQQLRSRRSKRAARTRREGGQAPSVTGSAGRTGCMVAMFLLVLPGMLLLI
jgi:hypothetical protein